MFLDTTKYDKYRPSSSGHDFIFISALKDDIETLMVVCEEIQEIFGREVLTPTPSHFYGKDVIPRLNM
jgi:hypothetical protein